MKAFLHPLKLVIQPLSKFYFKLTDLDNNIQTSPNSELMNFATEMPAEPLPLLNNLKLNNLILFHHLRFHYCRACELGCLPYVMTLFECAKILTGVSDVPIILTGWLCAKLVTVRYCFSDDGYLLLRIVL